MLILDKLKIILEKEIKKTNTVNYKTINYLIKTVDNLEFFLNQFEDKSIEFYLRFILINKYKIKYLNKDFLILLLTKYKKEVLIERNIKLILQHNNIYFLKEVENLKREDIIKEIFKIYNIRYRNNRYRRRR